MHIKKSNKIGKRKSNKSLIMKNNKSQTDRFKITLPIIKTRVNIVKDENGNEIEERFINGVASDTGQDLVGDIMAPSAIKSMADSLQQHIIEVNAEHDTSWRSELGEVVTLNVAKDNELVFEGKLNDMSTADDLWKALTKYNKQLGVSIGGYVREYELEKNDAGDWVRVFKDIELDHIAITSSPANPRTWVNSISKSLKESNETIKGLQEIEDQVERGEVANDVVEQKVGLLLKSIDREDLKEDVINLIITKDTEMSKKDTSLEAEEIKKDQTDPVVSDNEEVENSAAPEAGETVVEPADKSTEETPAPTDENQEETTEEKTEDEPKVETAESDEEPVEKEEVVTEPEVATENIPEEETEEATDDEEAKKSLNNAYTLVDTASYLKWAIAQLNADGKDTSALSTALETIKQAAATELTEPEETKSKVDEKTEDAVEKAKEVVAEATVIESDEELMKSIDALTQVIEERVTKKYEEETKAMIENLQKQVNDLSEAPAERKGVDITKGVGDQVDGAEVDENNIEELTKKMEAEIDDVKKSYETSGQKFASIQEIRGRYKQEYGIE
jgi:hypothetical protein